MAVIRRTLAAGVFVIAKGVFRLKLFRQSRLKHKLAMGLFRFSAERRHTGALSMYGHMLHFRGEGLANRIQGAIYIERAAMQGDAKSQYQAGRIYEYGFEHYFKPDPKLAFDYYQRGAKQGHLLATKRLIKVFERGELNQPQDRTQCINWQSRLEETPSLTRLNNAVIS